MSTEKSLANNAICPSYNCVEGASLLGIRQKDGLVALLPKTLKVDNSFISIAKNNETPPEQRFRFAGKCAKNGCNNWNKNSCAVAKQIVNFAEEHSDTALPYCPIREHCRWYKQEGSLICQLCPKVITDITIEEVNTYFNSDHNTSSIK